MYIGLRRVVNGGIVWFGTGLRRERIRAERLERPALSGQRPPLPARAMRAQVELAHPVYSVRRADRGPAPITRFIHLAGHFLDGGLRIRVVEGGERRTTLPVPGNPIRIACSLPCLTGQPRARED